MIVLNKITDKMSDSIKVAVRFNQDALEREQRNYNIFLGCCGVVTIGSVFACWHLTRDTRILFRQLGSLQRRNKQLMDPDYYRATYQHEISQAKKYAIRDAALQVLPVIDNIDRALDSTDKDHLDKEGVTLIQQQLNRIIQEYKLRLQ